MRLVHGSTPIATFDDWATHAPPKGRDLHWVPGRSAMELARAWCGDAGPCVPDEVSAAFRSHADLAALRIVEMTPEARVAFDHRRGEPRNSDLAGIAEDGDGEAVVHVEGKADETFGDSVRDTLRAAEARRERGEATGAPERVQDLVASLVPEGAGSPADLRYQLLTATAAVLADAARRKARKAVLLVHEFVTDHTQDAKHDANAADLNAFVAKVSGGAHTSIAAGEAIGPIHVPGPPLVEYPVPLYIAKAVRNVRSVHP
jgi:hypothetical protein